MTIYNVCNSNLKSSLNLDHICSSREETVGALVKGRQFFTFSPEETVEKIVQFMQRHDLGVVAITDASGRLVGILTERDILKKIFGFHGESSGERRERRADIQALGQDLTAWDVLVPNPACLQQDMSLKEGLEKIRDYGFRYMPVVSAEKHREENLAPRLVGIVSERELFWAVQDKIRREMEQKDSLLSYFMHHEPYGKGSC